jgi:hypothetical protein
MEPPRFSLRVMRCPPRGLALLGAALRCGLWPHGGYGPHGRALRVAPCPPRGLYAAAPSLQVQAWTACRRAASRSPAPAARRSRFRGPCWHESHLPLLVAACALPRGPLRLRSGEASPAAPAGLKSAPRSQVIGMSWGGHSLRRPKPQSRPRHRVSSLSHRQRAWAGPAA